MLACSVNWPYSFLRGVAACDTLVPWWLLIHTFPCMLPSIINISHCLPNIVSIGGATSVLLRRSTRRRALMVKKRQGKPLILC